MSEFVVMSKDDLKKFALDILAEYDTKHKRNIKAKEWLDEEEVLEFLGIKKPTLAKIRHERKVVFNTSQRPYTYNRESVELYKRSKAVGTI